MQKIPIGGKDVKQSSTDSSTIKGGWILPLFPGGILLLFIRKTALSKACRAAKAFKAVVKIKAVAYAMNLTGPVGILK